MITVDSGGSNAVPPGSTMPLTTGSTLPGIRLAGPAQEIPLTQLVAATTIRNTTWVVDSS